jgi:hypothetical protein
MKMTGLIVINPSRLSPMGTSSDTLAGRSKRLRSKVKALMDSHPEFTQARYGSMLAYRRRILVKDFAESAPCGGPGDLRNHARNEINKIYQTKEIRS